MKTGGKYLPSQRFVHLPQDQMEFDILCSAVFLINPDHIDFDSCPWTILIPFSAGIPWVHLGLFIFPLSEREFHFANGPEYPEVINAFDRWLFSCSDQCYFSTVPQSVIDQISVTKTGLHYRPLGRIDYYFIYVRANFRITNCLTRQAGELTYIDKCNVVHTWMDNVSRIYIW